MTIIERVQKRKRKTSTVRAAIIGALAVTAMGLTSRGIQAATFDATADFSITNGNPNGVWTYGFESISGGSLTLFNATSTQNFSGSTFQFYQSSVVQQSQVPAIFKNLGPNATLGLPVGSIALHGGPNNEFAVLRFTAPITDTYTINAQFFVGDTGDTDATIALNNQTAVPLFFAPTTDVNPSFNTSLNLTSGETLDFIVGTKGTFSGDTTPLNVIITNGAVAVPEASTFALALPAMGMVGLVLIKRRKK